MANWFDKILGGSDTTTTAQTSMPEWLLPYAQNYMQGAANIGSQPYTPYEGNRVAGLNQQFGTANDLVMQRATQGAPDLNAGRGAAMTVAQGDYLNANPYLNPQYTNAVIGDTARTMSDAMARGGAANTAAMFQRNNAFGGSAYQDQQAQNMGELAKQVGNMSNQYQLGAQQLGASDWRGGVGQMLQGGQLAGTLAQDDWTAAKAAAGMGDVQRTYDQQVLDDQYARFKEAQSWPYAQSNFIGNAVANAAGGNSTASQTTPGSSGITNAIGLGLTGAALWNAWNGGNKTGNG